MCRPSHSALFSALLACAALRITGAALPFPPGTVQLSNAPDLEPPVVLSLAPADGGALVPVSTALVIRFNEDVAAGAGRIQLRVLPRGSVVRQWNGSSPGLSVAGGTATVTLDSPLDFETNYAVTIEPGAFTDASGNPFAGFADYTVWDFRTAPDTLPSSPVALYYLPAQGLAGGALQDSLHDLIDDHTVIGYDTADEIMEVLDAVSATELRLVYSTANLPKDAFIGGSGDPATSWNREHTWPRNDGVGNNGADFSDLHHLFPCQADVNELRSARPFDYVVGGGLLSDPFAPESRADDSPFSWEPLDRDKGLVARALLYMMVRYDGGDPNTVDLVLDDTNLYAGNDMGNLTTLLEWNRLHPPDAYEVARNEAIFSGIEVGGTTFAQGNRNPFVDFPQFADAIFLGPGEISFAKWQLRNFTLEELTDPAVSGAGGDANGDGETNYFKFLTMRDPRVFDGPALAMSRDGNFLTLRFHRPNGDAVPETARLETATNLGDPAGWSTVPNWESASQVTDLGEYDRIEYTVDLSAAGPIRLWRVVYE